MLDEMEFQIPTVKVTLLVEGGDSADIGRAYLRVTWLEFYNAQHMTNAGTVPTGLEPHIAPCLGTVNPIYSRHSAKDQ